MTTCQMAGGTCPRPATTLVRIGPPVGGDRRLCDECVATLKAMGMSFRRIDEKAPLPAWRTHSRAKDLTGALIG